METSEPAKPDAGFVRQAWRRLSRIGAWLGLLGLFTATALTGTARWFWLGEIAASFRWYLGWAGLAGTLLLCLTRDRRLALAAAVLSIWHVWPELSLYFGRDAAREHGTELTIASANLLRSNVDHQGFVEWLDRVQPDVVVALELSLEWREVVESSRASYPHVLYAPRVEDWNADTWGTAILSRLPFVETDLRRIEGAALRPVMEAVVLLDGRRVTIRGVHPPRPGKPWRNRGRNLVLNQVAGMEWGGAGILLGDFNVTSTSPVFEEILERSGLRDTRRGFGRQASWYTDRFLPGLGIAIDHVLVGEDFVVLERHVDDLPGSDHRIAVATIAL